MNLFFQFFISNLLIKCLLYLNTVISESIFRSCITLFGIKYYTIPTFCHLLVTFLGLPHNVSIKIITTVINNSEVYTFTKLYKLAFFVALKSLFKICIIVYIIQLLSEKTTIISYHLVFYVRTNYYWCLKCNVIYFSRFNF